MGRIAIVGGAGAMGRWFAKLFLDRGYEVGINDIDELSARRVCSELGCELLVDLDSCIEFGDLILISVPIEAAPMVARKIGQRLEDGKALTDVTSVKSGIVRAMIDSCSEDVELFSMHPMFSPRVPSLWNQTVLMIPIRPRSWYEELSRIFEEEGARVLEIDAKEHDRIMAVIQALTHFVYISAAATVRELEFDIRESRKYASPVYELMLDLIARIIGQNPYMYARIQMENPHATQVRRKFLECASELARIVEERDVESFVKIMREAARHFKDVDEAMRKSDRLIRSLQRELEFLKDMIGEKIALRHIYSGTIHYGILESVDSERITLRDPRNPNRRISLKVSNVELVDWRIAIDELKKIFPVRKHHVSFLVPERAEPSEISKLLERVSERNVLSVRVADVYRGENIPAGMKSVTLELEILDDGRREDLRIKREMEVLIENLGYVLR